MLAGELDDGGVDRFDPAGVDDGDPDSLGVEPLGDLDRDVAHRADGDDEHVLGTRAHEHVGATGLGMGRDVGGRWALGEAHDGGAVCHGDGLPEQLPKPGRVTR